MKIKTKLGELLREALQAKCPDCDVAPILEIREQNRLSNGVPQLVKVWDLHCSKCWGHSEWGDVDSLHLVCANWIEQCTGKRPELGMCCAAPVRRTYIEGKGTVRPHCGNCGALWEVNE